MSGTYYTLTAAAQDHLKLAFSNRNLRNCSKKLSDSAYISTAWRAL